MTLEHSTVFIVDGDAAARQSVHALAAPKSIATAAFASAEEFLGNYAGGEPGCLITELRMAGMSGLVLLQSLKQRDALLPTIVLTDSADVQATVEVMRLGAFTLLEKPCCDRQLWETIGQALVVDAKQRALRRRKLELCSRIESFTEPERQVMGMVLEGLPNKTIASRLGLSLRTIETRRKNIFRKMETDSVARLVSLVREAEQSICCCNLTQTEVHSWAGQPTANCRSRSATADTLD